MNITVLILMVSGLFGGWIGETAWADSPSLNPLIEALRKTPQGVALLNEAEKRFNTDTNHLPFVRWGKVSRTDAVLVRHFDPITGIEERERKITIYLKRDQAFDDQLLDLAHELTHAVRGQSWDPYDPHLNAPQYIWNAIEADGGEVDAVWSECLVAQELKRTSPIIQSRCGRYIEAATLKRERIREDFYRVGHWLDYLKGRLDSKSKLYTLLSGEAPQLYSSTGQSPYPASLYEEYQEITQIACENSRRRLESEGGSLSRAPASTTQARSMDLLRQRCGAASLRAPNGD